MLDMKIFGLVVALFLAVPLLWYGVGPAKTIDFGQALSKLEQDSGKAANDIHASVEKADEKVEQANKNPADPSLQKGAANNLQALVHSYDNHINELEDDLRIVKASGEARLQQITDRCEQIRSPVTKATELERVRVAHARFERQLATAREKISELKAQLQDARDAAIVAENSQDLAQLNNSAKSVISIANKAQTLLVSLQTLTKDGRDLVAMGS